MSDALRYTIATPTHNQIDEARLSSIYAQGDMCLIWANKGDLYNIETGVYRNQVIRELIEKALVDASEICQERYLPDERAKVLRYLSEWLKSQMEGE